MGDLSENFSRDEFACKCGCGFDTVDAYLLDLLQRLRDQFGEPVTITSGCRCPKYNKKVGGSKNSQHLLGRAADIAIADFSTHAIAHVADDFGAAGIGRYRDIVHIDTRTNGPARWEG